MTAPVPILIGLGGNLPSQAGDPKATCLAALAALKADGVSISRRSSWYATAPVPVSDQPWFTNAVAAGETSLSPEHLLALLHRVEGQFGRIRGVKNGARSLDLDLLAYGNVIETEKSPLLPHPRLQERAFVLEPLAEIAPGWVHPVFRVTAAELLDRLPKD